MMPLELRMKSHVLLFPGSRTRWKDVFFPMYRGVLIFCNGNTSVNFSSLCKVKILILLPAVEGWDWGTNKFIIYLAYT